MLGLPIVFFGMMDRDLSPDFVLANPKVYVTGRLNSHLNLPSVLFWLGNAFLYSIVFCLVMYYALQPILIYYGIYEFGTFVFASLVYSLTVKVCFIHHQWNYINVLVVIISLGGTLGYFKALSGISFWLTYGNYYYSSEWVYAQSLFWFFAIFTTPLICFLIDFVFYNLHYTFLPSNEMLFRDAEAEVITLFFNYTMISLYIKY